MYKVIFSLRSLMFKQLSWFLSLPVQIFLALVFAFFLQPFLPQTLVQLALSLGFLLKDLLIFCMPFFIFVYLASSMMMLGGQSFRLLFFIFGVSSLSNAFFAFIASFMALTFVPFLLKDASFVGADMALSALQPLFRLTLPCALDQRLIFAASVLLGGCGLWVKSALLRKGVMHLRVCVTFALQNVFVRLLPLYVFAEALRMKSMGSLDHFLATFGGIFVLTHVMLAAAVFGGFFMASRLLKVALPTTLKAFFPVALTACTTLSGLMTLPVLMRALEKVLKDGVYGRFMAPLVTNLHTLANSVAIPLLAVALFYMQNKACPSLYDIALVVLCYCLSRFIGVCVPSGGALVVVPFLVHVLGLSHDFIGLFLALYMLQEPLLTMWNSLGNGILTMFLRAKALHPNGVKPLPQAPC